MFASAQLAIAAPVAVVAPVAPQTSSLTPEILHKYLAAEIAGQRGEMDFAANVFYELGIAHTLGKPVIPLMTINTIIPFDVSGFPTIYYDPNNLSDLKHKLSLRIKMNSVE